MSLKKSLLLLTFSVALVIFLMMPSLKGVDSTTTTTNEITFSPNDSMKDLQVKVDKMNEQIKLDGGTFSVGITPAMQYSLNELCTAKPELAKNTSGVNPSISVDPIIVVPVLPSSYTGLCANVKPVRNLSTCVWNYLTCEAAETAFYLRYGSVLDFSEQYVLDCNCSGYTCNNGWFSFDTFVSCPTTCGVGVPAETGYYAFDGIQHTCDPCYPLTKYALAGYTEICSSGVCDTTSIKTAIYNYGMVVCGVYVTSYFQAYTSGCFSYNGVGTPNHLVILCGWNDTTPCTTGGWKLKNSWGTAWGQSGYMWIKYGVSQVGYRATYCYR
ncbi:MAG: C1 family peptidase [Candidatus Omnitrophota bacterium]